MAEAAGSTDYRLSLARCFCLLVLCLFVRVLVVAMAFVKGGPQRNPARRMLLELAGHREAVSKKEAPMKLSLIPCLAIAATALAPSAAADPPAAPLEETPRGSGTQADRVPPENGSRVRPGAQADAALGTGFRDVYAVGVSGRLGYAFASGLYAGGAFTQFVGSGSDYGTFLGVEGGYKLFPTSRWEVRPYAFVGPAFLHHAGASETDLALQPSVASAYHFGPWFLSADARAYVVPSPATLALLVGGGAGF